MWRARLFLFIGFAFMAGGLAGSVSLLVLKYILMDYPEQYTYYGYANSERGVDAVSGCALDSTECADRI